MTLAIAAMSEMRRARRFMVHAVQNEGGYRSSSRTYVDPQRSARAHLDDLELRGLPLALAVDEEDGVVLEKGPLVSQDAFFVGRRRDRFPTPALHVLVVEIEEGFDGLTRLVRAVCVGHPLDVGAD